MADFNQYENVSSNVRRVGAKRDSKNSNFEFEEHQMYDYNSTSNNVSYNPSPKQPYHKSSSSSSSPSSAPIPIPDYVKIYKTSQISNEEFFKIKDGEDVDEVEKIPPHEYIAKKLASSQISSFSVFEGAGRTLKGRDLSRVRNAILTKTGFLE